MKIRTLKTDIAKKLRAITTANANKPAIEENLPSSNLKNHHQFVVKYVKPDGGYGWIILLVGFVRKFLIC